MKGYLVRHPDGDYRTCNDWGSLCEAYAYISFEEAKLDADKHNGTIIEVPDLQKYIKEKCLYISEAKEGFDTLEEELKADLDIDSGMTFECVSQNYFWWRDN